MSNEKIEVLSTAEEYITNLNNAIAKAAEYLQNGDYYNGMNLVINITDGLEWVIKLVTVRKDIYSNNMEVDEFTDKIKEVVDALENQDYILIGDLLQYEISPIIENYYNETINLIKNFS